MSERSVHARRRARFFDAMGEGVALLFAAPEASFGHDVHYRYRPDPDLLYLTGFREPGATAVLDSDARTFTLFVLPRDRERETWEGRRAGPEGAVAAFGADKAWPAGDLEKKLPDLLRKARVLHHALGLSPENDRLVAGILARFRREARHAKRGPVTVSDPTDLLHAMRLVKSPEEIALLERAAAIAASAHRDAQRTARPGCFEYEIEAAIDRRFRTMGASGPAYPTIVASGENATILHYVENDRPLADGDLLLVDAGAESQYYASDVTRTYPVGERFSEDQLALYEIVLDAQLAAVGTVQRAPPSRRRTKSPCACCARGSRASVS